MTEKRFGFEMDKNCYKCIADIRDKKLYTDKKQVVDLLNKIADENEQLNLISNHRGEMVSFATSIIQDMGSEEMLKMWNDFREVMYQKWKKRD